MAREPSTAPQRAHRIAPSPMAHLDSTPLVAADVSRRNYRPSILRACSTISTMALKLAADNP